jgi:hypothetical protein
MPPYLRAFGYPFEKSNLGVMMIGAGVFVGVPLALSFIPISGVLVLIVQVFLVAYYAVFLHSILRASMAGREEFPAWPDEVHGLDLAEEILALAGPYVISFLPLIVLRCLYAHWGELGRQAWGYLGFFLSGPAPYYLPDVPPWFEPVSWGLAGLGLLYLPMALLVWSFFGGTSILNPIAVFRSAGRTGASYLLLVVLLAGLFAGFWGVDRALARVPFDGLRSLLSALALFYVLIVGMRLVGTHYLVHRSRLEWDPVPSPPL